MRHRPCLLAFVAVLALPHFAAGAEAGSERAPRFTQRGNLSIRADERTERPVRWQYRLRHYASLAFAERWTLNTMVSTGASFASAWNTALPEGDDPIHLRRLYLRRTGEGRRTEVGVIPSLKGAAASTGLSQDGWLTGLRHVRQLEGGGALEAVIGELDRPDEPSLWNAPGGIDYLELEYSGRVDETWSWEASAEEVLDGSYLRAELRHENGRREIAAEFVQRVDETHSKWTLSLQTALPSLGSRTRLFAYYAYVPRNFGERAELTEDFLATGHAFSAQLTGRIAFDGALRWFLTLERYVSEDRNRVQAGLRVDLP